MKNKRMKFRLLSGVVFTVAATLSCHRAHALVGGIGENLRNYHRVLVGTTLASVGGVCLFAARTCQNAKQRVAASLLYVVGTAATGYGLKEILSKKDTQKGVNKPDNAGLRIHRLRVRDGDGEKHEKL